mgnify:CR=1 FL=1
MDELKFLEKVGQFSFPGIGELRWIDHSLEIYKTKDSRAYFIQKKEETLVYIPTKIGVPAYYPLVPAGLPGKIKAVLMDLDGTSVKSEEFWIWVIEEIVRRFSKKTDFKFEQLRLLIGTWL